MTESQGARLKKIRLEKGLSLQDVHKKTKINLDILKAIEEDSIVNLSPIYIKGFLKIYCQALGVDFKDYIADQKGKEARLLEIKDERQPAEEPQQDKPVQVKAPSIKLGSFHKVSARKIIRLSAIGLIFVVLLLVLFNLGKFLASRPQVAIPKKPKITAVASTPIKAQTQKKPEPAKPVQKAAVSASTVGLTVSAKEDCLIQVKMDGRVVFHRVLKRGRSESWEAKEKIELLLGNAGVVTLVVNGQPIPPVGRKGQSIKKILITKEGINIPK